MRTIPLPKLHGTRLNLPRQRLHPIRRNQQRMLELRRPPPVPRSRRPIVLPHQITRRPLANHRLDRERVPRRHLPRRLRVAVVQNVGVGVKHGSHAVAAETFDRGESVFDHVILDDGADVFVVVSGFDEVEGFDPAVVGGLDEAACYGVGGGFSSDDEHFAAVAVVAI